MTRCPDPETLAAFAKGRLTGAARAEVVQHLDACEECVTQVALAMKSGSESRSRSGWWMAIAAALLLAIAGGAWWSIAGRAPMKRLIALAPRTERTVEPRLCGGFDWAAYHGTPRAAAEEPNEERMKIVGAAGELVTRAKREPGADAQHDAGVALVMAQDPLAAIDYLERAARAGNDASRWNDLAAARYAAAAELQRASLYPEALAAVDRAIALQPAMPEALFNRALILGRLALWNEARRAWTRYLEVDPASPWAAEARRRLAELPVATKSDPSRGLAETEYLGQWGESLHRGDAPEAERFLALARSIGDTSLQTSGDALLHESVQTIDAASAADRELLADAHARYRRARMSYAHHQLTEARSELLRAAADFDARHSPMALAAQSYAASVRLASGDTAGARTELETVLTQISAHPRFLVLAAQTRSELGRAHLIDGDAPAAIPLLADGAALLTRAGERNRAAFIEAILAFALASAGRGDEGWDAQIRAFDALSAEGGGDQLTASIDGAVRMELLAGRRSAALALARLDRAAERADARAADAIDALVQRTLLESAEGNDDEAVREAAFGEKVAARIEDPVLRQRLSADAAFAAGAARASREPVAARALLTRAIDYYRANDLAFALPEPLLLRARCAVRAGDRASSARDLDEGIRIVEERSQDAPMIGYGALDARRALFDDAITLALDRGDPAGAFAVAERARGGTIDVRELQRRLSGSGTVVLEIAALPEQVVTFAVSDKTFDVSRQAGNRDELAHLSNEELYDDLIRPLQAPIARGTELIVVPDPALATTPFAALDDRTSHRHLIEMLPVAMAVSATSLEPLPRPRSRSLTAIALASGPETQTRGLAEVRDELEDVTRLYASARTLRGGASFEDLRRGDATVIHIAGHTRREPGGGEQAFLFGVERITWKEIVAAKPIKADVAVLSACETLRPPASLLTRAPSLGAAFLAAGAANVVGTLTTISDADARALFRAFHTELAAGDGVAAALRRVQIAAMHRADAGAWQSIALMTRSIR